jgi:iron complex transport system ATP-binding protein
MKNAAITIKSLTFHRSSRTIFKELSFTVESGKFVALIGPNGTGKSTLLKCLAGIHPIHSGEIKIFDASLQQLKPIDIAKRITYMPQTTTLETNFTVQQVVEMGRYPHKKRFSRWSTADKAAVDRALVQVGICHLKDRFVPSLSGGERQLVYLAKAIAQETDILLLDEPTSDLDIYYQVIVTDIIRSLIGEGKTIIAAIHDINLATRICEQCILLKNGRFVAYNAPSNVINNENIEETFQVKSIFYKEPLTEKKQLIPYDVLT